MIAKHHTQDTPVPYAQQRDDRLTDQIRILEDMLIARGVEINALLNEVRQLRTYTGTDIHIAAQAVTIREQAEMIAGLRETIKGLMEG
jgi:hypothetical protein